MKCRSKIRHWPILHISTPLIIRRLGMLATSWSEKFLSLLSEYKMVYFHLQTEYSEALKVHISVQWIRLLTSNSWFLNFTQTIVIFWWTRRSYKWGQLQKGRLLMMWYCLNGHLPLKTFCTKWGLLLNLTMFQPIWINGSTSFLDSSRVGHRPLLTTTCFIISPIRRMSILIVLCQGWKKLLWKFKFQSLGRPLFNYLRINIQQGEPEFWIWIWWEELRTKRFSMRNWWL